MTTMEWTNSRALELLELYQRETILWDTSQKEYRDRHKRKKAYRDIARHLACSSDDVESKINRLRSQYNRELSKEKHYESCGAIYKSRWFAFEIMANLMANNDGSISARSFADKHDNFQLLNDIDASQCIKVEQDSSDLTGDDIDMETPKISLHDFIPMARALNKSSSKKRTTEDEDGMYEVAKKMIKSGLENEDSLLPFGLHVVSELKQLSDPHVLAKTKFKINEILFKAAMGSYDRTDEEQQHNLKISSSEYAEFENEKEGENSTATSSSVAEQKHILSNLTLQDNIEDEFLNTH